MSEHRLAPSVTEADHALGPANAPATLVEYGDFECPYCGAAYPVLARVRQRLGDRLRFVFRPFPLADLHPHAAHAAEAAESVSAQRGPEAFWAMHDLLFSNQDRLTDADLTAYAQAVGAGDVVGDGAQRFRAAVENDYAAGAAEGVRGTPTLFVNARLYTGRVELGPLRSALGLRH